MKALYSYFGLIDLHDIDSPGHSLYQLGLLDSIRQTFYHEKFDFYCYYPEDVVKSASCHDFPSTELGNLFRKYKNDMINEFHFSIDEVIKKIMDREYSALYLKARFRNLSTLAKKWKDAHEFELIICAAIEAGYKKESIVILDTDLSLSEKFISTYQDKITILVPSIDFPGISDQFLNECVAINLANPKISLNTVFYGNLDTSNYKSGNEKSSILAESLTLASAYHNSLGSQSNLTIICKSADFKKSTLTDLFPNIQNVERHDRLEIWHTLENSGAIMLNVTKQKYDDVKFIPARIFEAMIFGLIPVSYQFNWICPSFSFNNTEDLREIYSYLDECSVADLNRAYKYFIDAYLKYAESTYTAKL